jgi:hypothetical protein
METSNKICKICDNEYTTEEFKKSHYECKSCKEEVCLLCYNKSLLSCKKACLFTSCENSQVELKDFESIYDFHGRKFMKQFVSDYHESRVEDELHVVSSSTEKKDESRVQGVPDFKIACGKLTCDGMIDKSCICSKCHTLYCERCLTEKKDDGHVCNETDLKTVKLIYKSRQCPKCKIMGKRSNFFFLDANDTCDKCQTTFCEYCDEENNVQHKCKDNIENSNSQCPNCFYITQRKLNTCHDLVCPNCYMAFNDRRVSQIFQRGSTKLSENTNHLKTILSNLEKNIPAPKIDYKVISLCPIYGLVTDDMKGNYSNEFLYNLYKQVCELMKSILISPMSKQFNLEYLKYKLVRKLNNYLLNFQSNVCENMDSMMEFIFGFIECEMKIRGLEKFIPHEKERVYGLRKWLEYVIRKHFVDGKKRKRSDDDKNPTTITKRPKNSNDSQHRSPDIMSSQLRHLMDIANLPDPPRSLNPSVSRIVPRQPNRNNFNFKYYSSDHDKNVIYFFHQCFYMYKIVFDNDRQVTSIEENFLLSYSLQVFSVDDVVYASDDIVILFGFIGNLRSRNVFVYERRFEDDFILTRQISDISSYISYDNDRKRFIYVNQASSKILSCTNGETKKLIDIPLRQRWQFFMYRDKIGIIKKNSISLLTVEHLQEEILLESNKLNFDYIYCVYHKSNEDYLVCKNINNSSYMIINLITKEIISFKPKITGQGGETVSLKLNSNSVTTPSQIKIIICFKSSGNVFQYTIDPCHKNKYKEQVLLSNASIQAYLPSNDMLLYLPKDEKEMYVSRYIGLDHVEEIWENSLKNKMVHYNSLRIKMDELLQNKKLFSGGYSKINQINREKFHTDGNLEKFKESSKKVSKISLQNEIYYKHLIQSCRRFDMILKKNEKIWNVEELFHDLENWEQNINEVTEKNRKIYQLKKYRII